MGRAIMAVVARYVTMFPMDAMQKARTPAWVSLLTPLVGAVGVLLAARRD